LELVEEPDDALALLATLPLVPLLPALDELSEDDAPVDVPDDGPAEVDAPTDDEGGNAEEDVPSLDERSRDADDVPAALVEGPLVLAAEDALEGNDPDDVPPLLEAAARQCPSSHDWSAPQSLLEPQFFRSRHPMAPHKTTANITRRGVMKLRPASDTAHLNPAPGR
jgi:hypothetical protein